jgi:hypothetical protein
MHALYYMQYMQYNYAVRQQYDAHLQRAERVECHGGEPRL